MSQGIELLVEAAILPKSRLSGLINEADELTAIFVTCSKNAKTKSKARP